LKEILLSTFYTLFNKRGRDGGYNLNKKGGILLKEGGRTDHNFNYKKEGMTD